MVCPLLFLSRMAASKRHLSLVLSLVPTAMGIHTVDGLPLAYRDLCPFPFPSLDPGHDPCRALVGVGRHADVCGMRGLFRLASYLILAKGDACSH